MRLLPCLLILGLCLPVEAQKFQVLSGAGTRQNGDRLTRGAAISEGDTLTIKAGELQILGDYDAFVATKGAGQFQATLLRRKSGCIRNLIRYSGRLSLVARPRTCAQSFLQVQSIKTGATYTFWGTAATLSDAANASAIAMEHGTVESSNLGQSVSVSGGFGNITKEGQPPGPPIALDQELKLWGFRIVRSPLGFHVTVQKNPLNRVMIQGIEAERLQASATAVLEHISGNALYVEITNLDGTRGRIYPFPLPTRR
jgi:hypothetical protein